MNILFIVPLNEPYSDIVNAAGNSLTNKLDSSKNIKKLYCVYPSGVLSISAYIKKHVPDANIRILDLNVVINKFAQQENCSLNDNNFEDFLKSGLALLEGFEPDIIGISILFSSVYADLATLAVCLKNTYGNSIITAGGHLASTAYDRIFKDDVQIDALLFGEGELPFLALVNAKRSGSVKACLDADPSWITKIKNGNVSFAPVNNVIVDLDEIPPNDLSMLLFPDAYFNSSSFLFMPEIQQNDKEMIMFSTRGCPFDCIFCASHQVHGKKVRFFSFERIQSDIAYYKENYGIKRFAFYDDHFLIKKERALGILDYIAGNGDLAAIINPAFFSIDHDIAKSMGRAGVRSVILSIESGNSDTFKNIVRKPSSLQKAFEAVEYLHEEGINAATNVMIGLPGETPDSIEKGVEYLRTANFDWIMCFVAAPLPGSDMHKICRENSYFVGSDDLLSIDFKKCVIKTDRFTPDYIDTKAYEMNLELNFVYNYNMRAGKYANALMLFERIINTVMDTHAFSYYYAAKCCKELSLQNKYTKYKSRYNQIIAEHSFWRAFADKFSLSDLE